MTNLKPNNIQAYNDALEQYALGQLSPAKHLMINCLKKISQEASERVKFEEDVAVSGLDEAASEALTFSFIANVLADLPSQEGFDETRFDNDNKAELDIDGAIQNVKWNKFIPMVSIHNIIGTRRTTGKERLYLFRAKPGAVMPEHSHSGDEWVLVLKGSYMSGGEVYNRGDIQMVNENDTHILEVSGTEECICLAMSEAKIKMRGMIPRIVQNILGV